MSVFRSEKSPIFPQLFCSVILIVKHQVFEDEDDDEHEDGSQFGSLGLTATQGSFAIA
jgi:hypothetical protein